MHGWLSSVKILVAAEPGRYFPAGHQPNYQVAGPRQMLEDAGDLHDGVVSRDERSSGKEPCSCSPMSMKWLCSSMPTSIELVP